MRPASSLAGSRTVTLLPSVVLDSGRGARRRWRVFQAVCAVRAIERDVAARMAARAALMAHFPELRGRV